MNRGKNNARKGAQWLNVHARCGTRENVSRSEAYYAKSHYEFYVDRSHTDIANKSTTSLLQRPSIFHLIFVMRDMRRDYCISPIPRIIEIPFLHFGFHNAKRSCAYRIIIQGTLRPRDECKTIKKNFSYVKIFGEIEEIERN